MKHARPNIRTLFEELFQYTEDLGESMWVGDSLIWYPSSKEEGVFIPDVIIRSTEGGYMVTATYPGTKDPPQTKVCRNANEVYEFMMEV